ncbi:hypothetical protein G9A89_005389 [Geosiphon pyriformis]|nr:hypothetical protein G9A89_005389 [Geosiphon pyriformis]
MFKSKNSYDSHFQVIESLRYTKQFISVIFATFKTPEWIYDEFDSMGGTSDLIDVHDLENVDKYVDNNIIYDKFYSGHGWGAAPRIGNDIFVRYMQKRIWVERVTVNNDYAPLFFGDDYLTHTSMETWIVSDKSCNLWTRYDEQIEFYNEKD